MGAGCDVDGIEDGCSTTMWTLWGWELPFGPYGALISLVAAATIGWLAYRSGNSDREP